MPAKNSGGRGLSGNRRCHFGESALEKRDRAAVCRAGVLAPKARAQARMRERSLNAAPFQADAGVNWRSSDLCGARLQINR